MAEFQFPKLQLATSPEAHSAYGQPKGPTAPRGNGASVAIPENMARTASRPLIVKQSESNVVSEHYDSRPWQAAQHRLWQKFASAVDPQNAIIGVSIGYRTVDGESTGERALVVMVRRKLPARDLHPTFRIPPVFNSGGCGFRTDVVESGEIRFTGTVNCGTLTNYSAGGLSSIACRVTVTGSALKFALGCAHALSNFGKKALGTTIYAPPTTFQNYEKIGTLYKRSTFKIHANPANYNTTDCALIQLTGPGTVSPFIANIGNLKTPSYSGLTPGMTVIAAGGTSNVKVTGTVESVGAIIAVADFSVGGQTYDYYPVIKVRRTLPANKPEFSKDGDSGMVLLHSPSLRPAGMIFAAAGIFGYAIPIAAIVSGFSIQSFVP